MVDDTPRSGTAGWARPTPRPLFAKLMSFPAACFIGTLLSDIVYARTALMTWETFSVWMLTIGLVVAGIVVVVGVIEGLARRVWPTRIKLVGYAVALVLSIVNAFVHSRDAYTSVVPEGLTLSIVVVAVIVLTLLLDRAGAARRVDFAR